MLATLPVGFRNVVARSLQLTVLGIARSQSVCVHRQVFAKNCNKFGAIQGQTSAKEPTNKRKNENKKGALQGALCRDVRRIRGELQRSD
jgi:hypothetical protein